VIPPASTPEQDAKVREFILAHPTLSRKKAAEQCGVTESVVRRVKHKMAKQASLPEPEKPIKLRGAIPAAKMIDEFDLPKKVREALPMLKGAVIQDNDFRMSLGVDTTRWARVKQLGEFQSYMMKVQGKLYWGDPVAFEELQQKMDVL